MDSTEVKADPVLQAEQRSGLLSREPIDDLRQAGASGGNWQAAAHRASRFDLEEVRAAFPALRQEVSPGVPLIYFDSAATSLKPQQVVQAVLDFMTIYPANVHRGLHTLSERATEAFEGTRDKVARLLSIDDPGQIVFTRGTTEAINLVAQSWGRTHLKPGDAILLS